MMARRRTAASSSSSSSPANRKHAEHVHSDARSTTSFVVLRSRAMFRVLVCACFVALSACVLEVPLEDKQCDTAHRCIDGFTCVSDKCVVVVSEGEAAEGEGAEGE